MQMLKIRVEIYPDLLCQLRVLVRRREQLWAQRECRSLSPLETDELALINARLATFACDVMAISDPQQRALH
ncbi:hypothetical protein [Microbulbifer sp. TYP-18]|uniref:hypothetical protein n=1 Tax=Microbulbifer sp. TYP-18 TaxID=3230024 RepID=UPI0034C689BC